MDYSSHNDELTFKQLLRRKLTREGISQVMNEVGDELLALADFLEDSDDNPAAERHRMAAKTLEEATDEVAALLNEHQLVA